MSKQKREFYIVFAVFIISCFMLIYSSRRKDVSEKIVIVNSDSNYCDTKDNSDSSEKDNSDDSENENDMAIFPVDLNIVTKQQLILIDGIGEKTAKNIIDYKNMHGEFKNMQELLNVDNIGEKTLEILKKYLYIKNPIYENTSKKDNSDNSENQNDMVTFPIDLNIVTKQQLSLIDGIGEKTAKNIIDYKNMHGEFKNMQELLNVDNIGEKTLEILKKYLYVKNPIYENISKTKDQAEKSTILLEKSSNLYVDINTATIEELQKLNSIGIVKAQAIIDYRKNIGLFYSIEEIKNVSMIGQETFDKIKNNIYVDIKKLPNKPVIIEKEDNDSEDSTQSEGQEMIIVNINTASINELLKVPGMKETYATEIYNHRQNGNCMYQSTEEIIVVCYEFKMTMSEYNKLKMYLTV